MMRVWTSLVVSLLALAAPASAQQAGGGTGRVQCAGCDSAQMAAARRRWIDSEIASLTTQLAMSRILYENLKSRLAPDSPEPPRSPRERAELQARLAAQSAEMTSLVSQLSARCGEQEPLRGYLGVLVDIRPMAEASAAGRATTAGMSYPVVEAVEPGSPAARAGLALSDTIIAINGMDARGRSLEPFVREPGERLSINVGREGERRTLSVTVGVRPPTFGGACMQYRDVRFTDASGQQIVMFRQRGAAGIVTGVAGTAGASGSGGAAQARGIAGGRTATGSGQQPVRIVVPDSGDRSAFIVLSPASRALFLSSGGSGAIVAGAEVSLVSGGLKAIFAVDHGALVLSIAPRSPASQAGLLEGDVIIRANGEPVTAIAVLQRAIQSAGDKRSVALDVIRAKSPRTITLRW